MGRLNFDPSKGDWIPYPTSNLVYTDLTLPGLLRPCGSVVWFNKLFGNRIGAINTTANTLLEYIVSDPPAADFCPDRRLETIALGGSNDNDRVWFTETSDNNAGYVDATDRA